jgi:hypothetical protein
VVFRRTFIGAVAAGMIAAPLAAGAQTTTTVRRIGFLSKGPRLTAAELQEAYAPLRELGWVEGRNLLVEQRVLPRVDDAAEVNFGTKVTKRSLSPTWSHRPSRSAQFVYGVMNLRDDEVGYTAALATQPHR